MTGVTGSLQRLNVKNGYPQVWKTLSEDRDYLPTSQMTPFLQFTHGLFSEAVGKCAGQEHKYEALPQLALS